jgi:hypothetical protein
MAPDRALPDILMPGNGASSSPRTRTNPAGTNSQTQSPISPLDGHLPFERPPTNAPLPGAVPSPRDMSQSDGRVGRRQDAARDLRDQEVADQRDRSTPRDRSRPNARTHTKSPGSTSRICKKCGETLTGQFVRALGGTFHLECFKCNVSGSTLTTLLIKRSLILSR